jgi:hypothetical protein
VDSLDTLVVMGNYTEFEKRVWWIVDNLRFDNDIEVSVFETNIRILGGLLSAHLLITHTSLPLITQRPYHKGSDNKFYIKYGYNIIDCISFVFLLVIF